MTTERAEQFVPALAALAQPTRLKIMEVVASAGEKGMAAGAIARAVHCPASTLSFHLKELSQAGLLQAEPQGRFIIYSVRAEAMTELSRFIAGYGQPPPPPPRKKPGPKGKAEKTAAAGQDQLSIFGD